MLIRPPLLALLALLALGAPARAQAPRGRLLGFALGGGAVPRVFHPDCGGHTSGSMPGLGVGLRGALPVGARLAIEARASAAAPYNANHLCIGVFLAPPNGISETQEHDVHRDGFLTTDIRLRYDLSPHFVLAGGAGWLWGGRAPYVALSPGVRIGGRVRFLLDADAAAAAIPYTAHVQEWSDGQLVRELFASHRHEWRPLLTFHAGMEFALR